MTAFSPVPLLTATGGDVALCNMLLAELRGSAAARVLALAECTTDAEWRRGLHALRGTAHSIGATGLAELAERAEEGGRDVDLIAALEAAVDALPSSFGDD